MELKFLVIFAIIAFFVSILSGWGPQIDFAAKVRRLFLSVIFFSAFGYGVGYLLNNYIPGLSNLSVFKKREENEKGEDIKQVTESYSEKVDLKSENEVTKEVVNKVKLERDLFKSELKDELSGKGYKPEGYKPEGYEPGGRRPKEELSEKEGAAPGGINKEAIEETGTVPEVAEAVGAENIQEPAKEELRTQELRTQGSAVEEAKAAPEIAEAEEVVDIPKLSENSPPGNNYKSLNSKEKGYKKGIENIGDYLVINDKKMVNDPETLAKAVRTMMNKE